MAKNLECEISNLESFPIQAPFGPDPTTVRDSDVAGRAVFAQSGQVQSIEAQLTIRELCEHIEFSRQILGEIRSALSLFKENPEDPGVLHRASERLERFCLEADSWGFSDLYQIGMGLQVLLVDCCGRTCDNIFWGAVNRALSMLATLLEQCESDFRWRLAIADTLDSLDQLSHA